MLKAAPDNRRGLQLFLHEIIIVFSEAVLFVGAGAFAFVAVAARIEGVLQCDYKRTAQRAGALIERNVAAHHRHSVVAGVEDVIGLSRDAETVVEECLIEFCINK